MGFGAIPTDNSAVHRLSLVTMDTNFKGQVMLALGVVFPQSIRALDGKTGCTSRMGSIMNLATIDAPMGGLHAVIIWNHLSHGMPGVKYNLPILGP